MNCRHTRKPPYPRLDIAQKIDKYRGDLVRPVKTERIFRFRISKRAAPMSTVGIAWTNAMDGIKPVISANVVASQDITPGAGSITSDDAAGKATICRITVSGGNVWVQFAVAPVAAAGSDYLLIDGTVTDFGFLSADMKVAVIAA